MLNGIYFHGSTLIAELKHKRIAISYFELKSQIRELTGKPFAVKENCNLFKYKL